MAAWWQSLVASIGGVVALFLFLSPMKAVLRARSERMLGDLNPLPFAAIAANCTAWIAYAYVVKDALLLWPNQCGFLLGLFYTFSCYGLSDTKTRDRQLAIVLLFAVVLTVVGGVGTLGEFSHEKLKSTWGYTANGILLIYYASPLSTVFEVVRTRCSASLNAPLSVMNVINGTLWLVYGLALKDYFIAVPNGIGAALGVVLIVLIVAFPRKSAKRSPSASEAGTSSSQRELMAGASSLDGERPLPAAPVAEP